MEENDLTLVEKCLSGDRAAFEQIVRRHAPLVGGIAYNILGDIEKSRDVVQETFLKAHRALHSLREPAHLRSWLAWIARTTCVDVLRKEHMRTVSLTAISDVNVEPAAPAERGPESIEKEELYERVLSILNGLPRIYKDIIMLRHLRKMSYKDIAKFMGIAEATVESRLHRAKLLLKERLKDLY